jgi:hypothetical protein
VPCWSWLGCCELCCELCEWSRLMLIDMKMCEGVEDSQGAKGRASI